jgi:hypothetical protein
MLMSTYYAWAPFTFGELNSLCPTGVYIKTRYTCNLFELGVRHKVGL